MTIEADHPPWDAGKVFSPPATIEASRRSASGILLLWPRVLGLLVSLGIAVGPATAHSTAPPLPKYPAIVLSAYKPWGPPPTVGKMGGVTVTFADWRAGQDLLARALSARHITQTRSGHAIYLYDPALVVGAIRDVVDEARRKAPAS